MAQGRKGEVGKLEPRQEKFCKLYVSEEFFGNGVQAYIEVYDIDQSKPNWYRAACSCASRLLSNAKVCERINELLDDAGLNDQYVDKQLLFLVTQHADFGSKLGAIREYNKLKQRITERFEHSGEVAFRGLGDAELEALARGTAGSSKRRTSA
jgi:hypothetical protein